MVIKFGDFVISEEAKRNLSDIINSNWISQGPKVKKFEEFWGQTFDYKHNIAVGNGTLADMGACLALYDYGASEGDEIIAPALAFVAVGNSIRFSGFKPVFVDVERETLNINPEKIEEKITPKTRAIMIVHTMGKPCEMDKIKNIADEYGLKVIEDSCEAHGAKFKGRFIGQWGDMATFSFYAAHVICCGEGGMISTNNESLAHVLNSVRNHGRESIYFDHIRPGLNLRMNDLTASIGIPEIEKFKEIFTARKNNLIYLIENTRDLEEFAIFNYENENEVISPHAFTITLKDPKFNYKELYKFLEDNQIQCKRNFGSIPTQHKAFSYLGHKMGDFPEAEYIGENGLHFGVHQYLSKRDLDEAVSLLHDYFKKFS